MKQCNLWLTVGTPGCGKSTFLKNQIKRNAGVRISRDDIRFNLVNENEDYFSHETEVFNIFIQKIKDALKTYTNVYVDATHLNWASRRKLLSHLGLLQTNPEDRDIGINVFYFNVPLDVCLERNKKREGRCVVPDTAVKRMHNSKTYPLTDPYVYDTIVEIDENQNWYIS